MPSSPFFPMLHQQTVPQSPDVVGGTNLCITSDLSIGANVSELHKASEWLAQTGFDGAVPIDELGRLDICLHEILANIIAHGGPGTHLLPIVLTIEVRHDQTGSNATMTISDSGAPFDPISFAVAAIPKTLADAVPGGLGIRMLRNNADSLKYSHSNGRNKLEFNVRWAKTN